MQKLRKILNILHDGLSAIDPSTLSTESLVHVDKKTGEMTPVGEYFGDDALRLVQRVKRGINDKVAFSTLFQKALEELMIKLKPNELRILLYFVSKMGYENAVFGITYRGVADKLGISPRTVTDAVNKLIGLNLLKRYGSKHKKVYYVNPTVAWKGSRLNIRKKTGMFLKEQPEKKIETPDGFEIRKDD